MKKTINSIFHFLGGIHLAITLITLAAIAVIGGTFIESKTDSHLLAASWTYEHPLFFLLLSLFFVNILFSALRRWPFKAKHIPFLITHLGLLMIIGGTMIKNRFGLQGQLTVWEGSGNQHVVLPHSYALLIEPKEGTAAKNTIIPLTTFRPNLFFPYHLPQLTCKLIGFSPHVKEQLHTWIKGSTAYIAGFPQIPVKEWKESEDFPEASPYHFAFSTNFPNWSIIAIRTPDVLQAIKKAYLQNLSVKFKMKEENSQALSFSLEQALEESFNFKLGEMKTSLSLAILEDNALPLLNLDWSNKSHLKKETWTIALNGKNALFVRPSSHFSPEPFFTFDLVRPHPLICLIDDDKGHTFFLAFDTYGRIHFENFTPSSLSSLMTYENGFGGYGVLAVVPIASFPCSREDKEKAQALKLKNQLQEALLQHPSLSPPLQFFKKACEKAGVDFSTTFVQLLSDWNDHGGFLYKPHPSIPEETKKALDHLVLQDISHLDQMATLWAVKLLEQLEQSWLEGEDLLDVLHMHHWPLIEEIKQSSSHEKNSILNLIAMQVHSVSSYFPPLSIPKAVSVSEKATLLSAYFRSYGIDYRSLFPFAEGEKEQFDDLKEYWQQVLQNPHLQTAITFETPLSHQVIPDDLPLKLEERRAGIVLQFEQGEKKQTIALEYDPSLGGLKWPILNGQYLIRFQPNQVELPYRIRLQQARQIFYPKSQQVYSYESDILISQKGQEASEQTLSMNKVHETWDGYRFYLSGIGTSSDGTIKRIQLAVNYDPAKNFLTYPGAFLVFLGTVLLFWGKKKNRDLG